MATLEQDTFATAGRGATGIPTVGTTIAAFSPASNGDPWIAQAATSTFSYNSGTSQGQVTGSTTANIATLNGTSSGVTKKWYDPLLSSKFQKTAVADGCAVVARFQDTNNYYRAEVVSNALNIVKLVNGVATTLATVAFTDGGAKFNIKLLCQGFGLNGTVNNLSAKAWLDSGGEPGAYQIFASDASLTQIGLVGVRLKGSTAGQTQSVDSFLAKDPPQFTPAPTYATLYDLPYGETLNVGATNPVPLPQQTIVDLQGIGNGATDRWQQQQSTIETAPGVYNWAILDDAVYRLNQAGIRVWLPLQGFASWRLTRDGYGNSCTLTAPVAAGVALTAIPVSALVPGTFIPHGGQLSVDTGGANPETVTINNPGNTYIAGATLLQINSWTPGFAHAVGAQIYEATKGVQLPSAADMATFAGLVAARYNGKAGQGTIESIQVFNEEGDIQTRIGAQANWDNGGAIIAQHYIAAYTAIKAVYPSCVVVAGAGRNAPTASEAHIINWLAGLCAAIKAAGIPLEAIDEHEYRDGVTDWNGNPVPDPRLNTYTDSSLATVNRPNIMRKLFIMRQVCAQYGFNPGLNIGEFGWLVYDDGSGFSPVTNATLTAGVPATSIGVASLAQNIPDATPIFIDTGGAKPEGPVYAWGQAALNGGATTIAITTNPAGHAQAQAPFTPASTHASGVILYAALGGIAQTQLADMQYSQAMYDAGRALGAAHMLRFTINSISNVTAGAVPQTVQGATGAPRSWTQTLSGVYTYAAGYYMTKLYAASPLTRTWQPQYFHSLPLVADAGSLPLASTANPGIVALTAPTP